MFEMVEIVGNKFTFPFIPAPVKLAAPFGAGEFCVTEAAMCYDDNKEVVLKIWFMVRGITPTDEDRKLFYVAASPSDYLKLQAHREVQFARGELRIV